MGFDDLIEGVWVLMAEEQSIGLLVMFQRPTGEAAVAVAIHIPPRCPPPHPPAAANLEIEPTGIPMQVDLTPNCHQAEAFPRMFAVPFEHLRIAVVRESRRRRHSHVASPPTAGH